MAWRTALELETSCRKAAAVSRIICCSSVKRNSMVCSRSGAVDRLCRFFRSQKGLHGFAYLGGHPAGALVDAFGGAPAIGDGDLAALGFKHLAGHMCGLCACQPGQQRADVLRSPVVEAA